MSTIPKGIIETARGLRQVGAERRELGERTLAAERTLQALETAATESGYAEYRWRWGNGCTDILRVERAVAGYRYFTKMGVWDETNRRQALRLLS